MKSGPKTITPLDRFMAKIVIREDGCWEWIGGKAPGGYGVFQVGTFAEPKVVRAHRWSYEHFVGPLPAGMHACHKCDFPSCCNPEHLFPGTAKDNAQDAARKGRNGAPKKLTPDQVDDIRRRYAIGGVIMRELADEYGVSKNTVMHAIRGQNYKHPDHASEPPVSKLIQSDRSRNFKTRERSVFEDIDLW